ncbi:MAG: radical SAM protein [Blautia sp.]|nr:radical SAM protein [Blautia sp.]
MITEPEKLLADCTLCPRACHVDRTKGERGFCGCGAAIAIAHSRVHMWEEPCISGEEGSGTVFFAGCALGCVFCQNIAIAKPDTGQEMTPEQLAALMLSLQEKRVNNINLVTPGHYLPLIVPAIQKAKKTGLHIPVLWNSSGYEDPDKLDLLEGLVDIFMPDFKYGPSSKAQRWSGVTDYFEKACAAIEKMYALAGDPVFDDRGMMTRGVLVRHLLLPGCVSDGKKVVDYLLGTYSDHIYISLMNQYTPMPGMKNDPQLGRKVTKKEYSRLVDHALQQGLTNGFIQEGEAASESFIPNFLE